MKFEIKNRWTGSVIFSMETSSLKLCVEAAVKAKTDLRAANLSAANLRAADLRAANLSAANLCDANLRDANLSAADLRAANLSAANLSAADLRAANLSAANLSDANLSDANLSDANLSAAKFSFTQDPTLPKRVAAAILNGPSGPKVDMGTWHKCETVHCIAGWAVHLSGAAGYALESIVGPATAGAMLMPSAVHMFHKTNEEAIQWAKENA